MLKLAFKANSFFQYMKIFTRYYQKTKKDFEDMKRQYISEEYKNLYGEEK